MLDEAAGETAAVTGRVGPANLRRGQRTANARDRVIVQLQKLFWSSAPIANVRFVPNLPVPRFDFLSAVAVDAMLGPLVGQLAPLVVVLRRIRPAGVDFLVASPRRPRMLVRLWFGGHRFRHEADLHIRPHIALRDTCRRSGPEWSSRRLDFRSRLRCKRWWSPISARACRRRCRANCACGKTPPSAAACPARRSVSDHFSSWRSSARPHRRIAKWESIRQAVRPHQRGWKPERNLARAVRAPDVATTNPNTAKDRTAMVNRIVLPPSCKMPTKYTIP